MISFKTPTEFATGKAGEAVGACKSVGEGDGDSVFKLREGSGVAEFVFTSIEGAGEVEDDRGLCESELFALLTWLKSITSFRKPG